MADAIQMHRTWRGGEDLEALFWSSGVVLHRGALTLSDHAVVADEIGRVVDEYMDYAGTAFEEISLTTWVRKRFEVGRRPPHEGRLCLAGYPLRGRGRLAGTWNGRRSRITIRSLRARIATTPTSPASRNSKKPYFTLKKPATLSKSCFQPASHVPSSKTRRHP